MKVLSSLLLVLVLVGAAVAQNNDAASAKPEAAKPQDTQASTKPSMPPTVASSLGQQTKIIEHHLVGLAEAMPEDKFDFAPKQGEFAGVRTFGQQLLHVAAGNFVFASMLSGEPSKISTYEEMENGPANIKGKAAIVQYLKDSFAAANKAIANVNEKNLTETLNFPFGNFKMSRLGVANMIAWHGFDHYGQLVVYSRMNGIVPPASRKDK